MTNIPFISKLSERFSTIPLCKVQDSTHQTLFHCGENSKHNLCLQKFKLNLCKFNLCLCKFKLNFYFSLRFLQLFSAIPAVFICFFIPLHCSLTDEPL